MAKMTKRDGGRAKRAEIRRLLSEVFSSKAAVNQWLQTNARQLDNRAPIEVMGTSMGADKVRRLVLSVLHGTGL